LYSKSINHAKVDNTVNISKTLCTKTIAVIEIQNFILKFKSIVSDSGPRGCLGPEISGTSSGGCVKWWGVRQAKSDPTPPDVGKAVAEAQQ
jgi:hypothetical protein